MQYVIVILEVASDTPGIDQVIGPFPTYADARDYADVLKAEAPVPGLIQVANVDSLYTT